MTGRRTGARTDAAFTLMEVMVALAILAMSLVTLSRSFQNSVRAANRARLMSTAVLLARYKMVEVEDKLFEEGFSDFEKEDKGDFEDEDEAFKRFKYTLKIDKVELPDQVDPEDMTDLLGSSSGSSSSSSSSSSSDSSSNPMQMLGGSVLATQFNMIRSVLENAIRRVQLKVEWTEGALTKEVTVVSYFTDPRVIDLAASGQLTPDLTSGQTPSTSSTGTTSTGTTSTGVTSGTRGSTPTLNLGTSN